MSAYLAERMMPDRKRSSAVRCLFPIDENDRRRLHEELESQNRKIDALETKRFMGRWGFDPVKGQPLENSPMEYSLVDANSVPAVYSSSFRPRPSRPLSFTRNQMRNSLVSSSTTLRQTKRKLRFENEGTESNDENQELPKFPNAESEISPSPVKQARVDNVEVKVFLMSNSDGTSSSPAASSMNPGLFSPPASPLIIACQRQSYSPSSPSVLSSSCPSILEAGDIHPRLSPSTMDVPGLSRSLSESSFMETLSPDTQAKDYITPHTKTSRPVQRKITDYWKHSKGVPAIMK